MTRALVCSLLVYSLAIVPASAQEPPANIETVGSLIELDVRPGPETVATNVKAKVGDLLQFRITSPLMGRAVLSLQVAVEGNAKKVAVVSTATTVNGRQEPASKGLSIFVLPERQGRATVKIVFTDNEGKPFRRAYNLEIVER